MQCETGKLPQQNISYIVVCLTEILTIFFSFFSVHTSRSGARVCPFGFENQFIDIIHENKMSLQHKDNNLCICPVVYKAFRSTV